MRTCLLLAGIAAVLALFTAKTLAQCSGSTAGHVYLSYAEQLAPGASPADTFRELKHTLRDLARAHQLEGFAITSSDLSISRVDESRPLDLQVSIGARMVADPAVLDLFLEETRPHGMTYSESGCIESGDEAGRTVSGQDRSI